MEENKYSLFKLSQVDKIINDLDKENKKKYYQIYEQEKKSKIYVYLWFSFFSLFGLMIFNRNIKYSSKFFIIQLITFILDAILLFLLFLLGSFLFSSMITYLILALVVLNIIFSFLEIEGAYYQTEYSLKIKILNFLEGEE